MKKTGSRILLFAYLLVVWSQHKPRGAHENGGVTACLSLCLILYLSHDLSTYLPTSRSAFQLTNLFVCLLDYVSTTCFTIYQPICTGCLPIYLVAYLSVYLPACLPVCLPFYLPGACLSLHDWSDCSLPAWLTLLVRHTGSITPLAVSRGRLTTAPSTHATRRFGIPRPEEKDDDKRERRK